MPADSYEPSEKKETRMKPCHFCGKPTGRWVVFGYCTFAVPCCRKCDSK